MSNYKQTYQHLVQSLRGSYQDLNYMPVFRSSAIFPAFHSKSLTTSLSCFNYWKYKNNCSEVGILVTVRDQNGTKIARVYQKLKLDSYNFHIADALPGDSDFSGSVEIEIFSSEDLKFQFPAVTCFYGNPLGTSYVHSGQRVYNHQDDENRGAPLNERQTAFDVLPNKSTAFVHMLNGPHALVDAVTNIEVLDGEGTQNKFNILIDRLPAYGLHTIHLNEDVTKDMGSSMATYCVSAPLKGMHCRFIVGNKEADTDWMSVTHSYPDFCNSRDIILDSDEGEEVFAIAPVVLLNGVDTHVIFYPVYGCDTLSIDVIFSCPTEQSVQTISTYTWNPQAGKQLRIPISQLYRLRYDAPEKKGGLIFLKIRCSGGTPARITYGLNYSINDHIGTNISTSALISKFWNTTPRTWKWGPIVPSKGGRNHILVSCFKLHEAPGVNHDLIFSIHGQNGSVHKSYFSMCNFSSMTICAEDFIEHDGCLDILWYTITATESIFDINQLFVSAHGRIGGDHSF